MNPDLLRALAEKVGTPFWLYDAGAIRRRIAEVKLMSSAPGMKARYAMKACSTSRVLLEMRAADLWIDAVSGNEVLRALAVGYPGGDDPPAILLTADVFRDNALEVVAKHRILPNIGSPGMVRALAAARWQGPISIRLNPGFGHGHVNSCDTGGPSSKHGIWATDLRTVKEAADTARMPVVMLHAHIGSGPAFAELQQNLTRLTAEFETLLPLFPEIVAVSLGGGLPHNYRDPNVQAPVEELRALFGTCQQKLSRAANRELRLEIEPGRYYVAPGCTLVARVSDVKQTRTNEKGAGVLFAMVDAGFVDLIRPAMYGSYHAIEVVGAAPDAPRELIAVAGPLCESGDVFTRDGQEMLQPRMLPRPAPGDLIAIHDAGAYGFTMSSNYNSIGRAPQLWLEEDGTVDLISRREKIDDLIRTETRERVL